MSIKRGDKVRFKGDPEQETYEVNYVNYDPDFVDLDKPDGSEWEYVPVRLLELVPEPVTVGDVYQGHASGDLYFVVGKESDGIALFVCEAEPRGVQRDYVPSQFQSSLYTLVRSGKDLK